MGGFTGWVLGPCTIVTGHDGPGAHHEGSPSPTPLTGRPPNTHPGWGVTVGVPAWRALSDRASSDTAGAPAGSRPKGNRSDSESASGDDADGDVDTCAPLLRPVHVLQVDEQGRFVGDEGGRRPVRRGGAQVTAVMLSTTDSDPTNPGQQRDTQL